MPKGNGKFSSKSRGDLIFLLQAETNYPDNDTEKKKEASKERIRAIQEELDARLRTGSWA